MNLIFILPGITLIIGLFALIEGFVHHSNPHLKGLYRRIGLLSEGIILILGSLAFSGGFYYKLGGWG